MASNATQEPQGASTVVPPTPHEVLEAQLLLAQAKKGKPRKKPLKASHTVSMDDGNASDKENEPGNNDGKEDVIHWHDPAFHHYSDTLLTIIEDSICFRKAFGFKGGDDPSVTNGGLSLIQTCHLIAPQLFPTHPETNMEKLAHAVKNRVSNLKKKYQAFRKELGETGQGLVEADHELEITVGTPLHNTWEKIKAKFKWYKRLHHLLSVNPVYDRPALANSSSSHDLQAVENVAKPMSASRHSPDWDDFGDDEDSVKSSPSPENSQAPPAVLAPLHPPSYSISFRATKDQSSEVQVVLNIE
ncbi:hypothetical protein F5887DRAFT_1080898 [Amanita rubescens]|nr:hypothetical protein F5887DRAFT_1080898 [Amanita rubescens]